MSINQWRTKRGWTILVSCQWKMSWQGTCNIMILLRALQERGLEELCLKKVKTEKVCFIMTFYKMFKYKYVLILITV